MTPIRLVEVGPRDGLQNEKAMIPTDVKVAFVNGLSEAGFDEIEVSSFVSPKWIPQLADAAEVFARITRRPGVRYTALVPNEVGLARAIAARADKVAVFTAASESFAKRNINATIAESIERFRPVVRASPVPVRGYVSTAWHCPYEGPIAADAVLLVCEALLEIGCTDLSIGDTIGTATSSEVSVLLDRLIPVVGVDRLAMHFHDTFGRATTNAERAAQQGIQVFDSSAGGIGGCPFAPGATGNVSTQALVELFGDQTRIDPVALERASGIVRPYVGG